MEKKKTQIGEQLKFINRTKKKTMNYDCLNSWFKCNYLFREKKSESCACDLKIAIV